MSTELVVIEDKKAVEVFSEDGIDKLITSVEEKVGEFKADLSTATSRKAIASMAANVARSKKPIDDMGKKLAKEIIAGREKFSTAMDRIRDETRKPLTNWEATEGVRIQAHKNNIKDIESFSLVLDKSLAADFLREQYKSLEEIDVESDSWEEFKQKAVIAKASALTLLGAAISDRQQFEDDQAELESLREAETQRQAQATIEPEKVDPSQVAEEPETGPKGQPEPVQDTVSGDGSVEALAQIDEPPMVRISGGACANNIPAPDSDIENKKQVNRAIHARIMELTGLDSDKAKALLMAMVSGQIDNVTVNY